MAEIIIMPKLGFDMTEGILIRWLKTEGDEISEGEVIAEIETDKATVEVESNFSGIVRKRVVEEGATVPIGNPIAIVGEAGEEIDFEAILQVSGQAKEAEATDQPAEAERKTSVELEPVVDGNGHLPGGVKASPIARRLAKDHGIDLKSISATGQGGRIVKRDVESYLESGGDDVASTPVPSISALPIPTMGEMDEMEGSEIPLSKLRSLIGKRMAQAKQQLPHFYLTAEIDAAPMMELRAKINEHLPDSENLSVNDFIVKAAALTLREFPNLNASLSENKIIRHGEINIGIAVAVEDGLLTVVVHNADIKPLRLISQDARNAVRRAREGRVHPDDIQGSTFTVSNLGMFDIDNFIAIINPPEAAILAIGSVAEVPIVQENGIVPGKRVKVTLSADHRVTDGAEAARWLQIFKGILEDPLLLLNLSALLS